MFNPIYAQAQAENIQELITSVGGLIATATGVLFGLALLAFLWGLTIFIFNAGNEKKLEDAKRLMFWGIIVLFVTFSIWGIVQFLQTTFGVQDPNVPIERGVDDPSDIPGPGGPRSA